MGTGSPIDGTGDAGFPASFQRGRGAGSGRMGRCAGWRAVRAAAGHGTGRDTAPAALGAMTDRVRRGPGPGEPPRDGEGDDKIVGLIPCHHRHRAGCHRGPRSAVVIGHRSPVIGGLVIGITLNTSRGWACRHDAVDPRRSRPRGDDRPRRARERRNVVLYNAGYMLTRRLADGVPMARTPGTPGIEAPTPALLPDPSPDACTLG